MASRLRWCGLPERRTGWDADAVPETATPVIVADRVVADPYERLARYACRNPRTLLRYDLAPSTDPDQITTDDITRTRVIHSRISRIDSERLSDAGAKVVDLLAAVPVRACLADADPAVHGGLYDRALAVFNGLLAPGIGLAKVSKLLHLKRPHLFPILDSRVVAAYRRTAAEAAALYQRQRPGFRLLLWAAIRDDLISDANTAALQRLRERLRHDADIRIQRTAALTDVRLLDILTWQPDARANPGTET
jgi:hypothetical protein